LPRVATLERRRTRDPPQHDLVARGATRECDLRVNAELASDDRDADGVEEGGGAAR